jgi:RNA polymerase sigma factor (sigma-70 family)
MGLSHSDVADAVQLTWLRLWQHGHQIRNPGSLGAWLVCTARREAIKLATAANRYVPHADLSGTEAGACLAVSHDVYSFELEHDQAVEHALGRLPARYRTLLGLLSSDLELSYSQIASRMGLPIGSIGPMRMRAIQMLRKTPEFIGGAFPRPAIADIAS